MSELSHRAGPPSATAEELALDRNPGESRLRSIIKAFSWRVIATLTTGLIAYFITGEIDTAVMIGGIEFVLKIAIYYAHERTWQLIARGSVRRLVE